MTKRTADELKTILADTERWLEEVDPASLEWEDPVDLRRVGLASGALSRADADLHDAVAAARANGRSWAEIGIVLGVSKQAAQQRFGRAPADDAIRRQKREAAQPHG